MRTENYRSDNGSRTAMLVELDPNDKQPWMRYRLAFSKRTSSPKRDTMQSYKGIAKNLDEARRKCRAFVEQL